VHAFNDAKITYLVEKCKKRSKKSLFFFDIMQSFDKNDYICSD